MAEEFRKLNQQIQQLAKEPEVLRQKRKGDYLMEHGKYVNAIKVYQKALRQETEDEAAVTDIQKPETVAAEKAETVQEAETTEASTETKTEEAAETESPVAITIDMVEDPEERAETENVEESEKPEEDTSETDATSLQEEKQEEVAADPELPHQSPDGKSTKG